VSELERCQACGVEAYRRLSEIAPEGWLFLESQTVGCGITVTWVCSKRCAKALWQRATGRESLHRSETEPHAFKKAAARLRLRPRHFHQRNRRK